MPSCLSFILTTFSELNFFFFLRKNLFWSLSLKFGDFASFFSFCFTSVYEVLSIQTSLYSNFTIGVQKFRLKVFFSLATLEKLINCYNLSSFQICEKSSYIDVDCYTLLLNSPKSKLYLTIQIRNDTYH